MRHGRRRLPAFRPCATAHPRSPDCQCVRQIPDTMPPAFVTRLNQASTSLRRAFDPDHRRQRVRSRRLGNYSESSRRGIFFRAAALGDAGPARVPVRRRALKPTAAASGVNRRRRACPRAVVALGPWARRCLSAPRLRNPLGGKAWLPHALWRQRQCRASPETKLAGIQRTGAISMNEVSLDEVERIVI